MAEQDEEYVRFLSRLAQEPTRKHDKFTPHEQSAMDIYQQLCLDFPDVAHEQLAWFRDQVQLHMRSKQGVLPLPSFCKLQMSFLQGLQYGIQVQNEATAIHAHVYGLMTLTCLKSLLACQCLDDIRETVYKLDQPVPNKQPPLYNTEPIAASARDELYGQEDPDDFVYEGPASNTTESHESVLQPAPVDMEMREWQSVPRTWEALEPCIEMLLQLVSYEWLSVGEVWHALDSVATIQAVILLLHGHKHWRLHRWLPKLIFVLRDRMLHHPEEIGDLIAPCLSSCSHIQDSTDDCDGDMLALAILSGLSNRTASVADGRHLMPLWRAVHSNLSRFRKAAEMLANEARQNRFESASRVRVLHDVCHTLSWFVEHASLRSLEAGKQAVQDLQRDAILFHLLPIFFRSSLAEDITGPLAKLLSLCCVVSDDFAVFSFAVPGLVDFVRTQRSPESVIWLLSYVVHVPPSKTQESIIQSLRMDAIRRLEQDLEVVMSRRYPPVPGADSLAASTAIVHCKQLVQQMLWLTKWRSRKELLIKRVPELSELVPRFSKQIASVIRVVGSAEETTDQSEQSQGQQTESQADRSATVWNSAEEVKDKRTSWMKSLASINALLKQILSSSGKAD
eukprot:GILJ01009419.1.p1 GENE.GILJ01009419.1~~GILJ01009419.1.p1  ORF type:complete len:621 (+),score=72.59 GILJ01009419.1:43-1905(+)